MNKTVTKIRELVVQVEKQLRAVVTNDQPFSQTQASWPNPGVNRAYVSAQFMRLLGNIDSRGQGEISESQEKEIAGIEYPLTFLKDQTIPNLPGGPAAGVPAIVFTIDAIEKVFDRVFPPDSAIIEAGLTNAKKSLREIGEQIRGIEAKLNALEPRSADLDSMVARIESAYSAADKLPSTLAELEEQERQIAALKDSAVANEKMITDGTNTLNVRLASLTQVETHANATIKKANEALEGATSASLAAAFTDRAKELKTSVQYWVGGLIVALAAGGLFGHSQITNLILAIKDKTSNESTIVMYGVLAFLSIAGPIWFAWLATKNIGQRQRLAEDYAFKGSISRAYEGYKNQAIELDEEFQKTLFSSALARLDEQPLRLVESKVDGSPWHAALDSEAVKKALSIIPEFKDRVTELARTMLAKDKKSDGPVATAVDKTPKAEEVAK